jgi:hypothetical protein
MVELEHTISVKSKPTLPRPISSSYKEESETDVERSLKGELHCHCFGVRRRFHSGCRFCDLTVAVGKLSKRRETHASTPLLIFPYQKKVLHIETLFSFKASFSGKISAHSWHSYQFSCGVNANVNFALFLLSKFLGFWPPHDIILLNDT